MQLSEIQKHMAYLFRAALKKCGNFSDAEDLTQEVLLAALQQNKAIKDQKAWLSTVLNHKYYDMLRRKYKLPTVCIDFVPEAFEMFDDPQNDDRPDAKAVRREVAYLSGKYREAIVRHYLQGEKVQDIADDLCVPKGTVLSRLSAGRKQMQKGFEKMDFYEKQSYQPERLDISVNGCSGFHDEPWSFVANDLMKQNILIVAYEKPVTCVEIAKALGIPTAYIEQAVSDLVGSELMQETGNKYFTDFMIATPDAVLKGLDVQIAFTEKHYDALFKTVTGYLEKLRGVPFTAGLAEEKRRKLEYYFILHLFSTAIFEASRRIVPGEEVFPQRPDGGRWIAQGNRYPLDFDFENYEYGKYCYGGMRGTYFENFLSATAVDLHVYDTQPDLNRYQHGPVELDDDNLAKMLYILSRGIPFDQTGFNPMFLADIPHLTQCGILGSDNGKPVVDLPILTPEQYRALDQIRVEQMYSMADWIEQPLRDIFPALKIEIPKHLENSVAGFRQYACYAIPMAFIKKAIACGDFDAKDATPPMVLVIEDAN